MSETGEKAGREISEGIGGVDWYAVRVAPNREEFAQRILTRLGVLAFLPMRSSWRRRNRFQRRKARIEYPLLPRYVFVGLQQGSAGWMRLFETGLIRGVVCAAGRPYRFEHAIIEDLNRRYFEGEFRAKGAESGMRSRGEYAEGDDVFVVDGPFEGRRVRVEKIVGVHAAVKFDLLGGPRLVDVPLDALVKAD